MILLIPIALLLLAALAIFIIDLVRPRFGLSWLIAAVASLIAWGFALFLRFRLPTELELGSWEAADLNILGRFSLLLDYDNWPYVLILMTITLAVILSDAARTRYDSTPQSWVACLVIAAMGLFSVQSGTSLTLMIAWIIVDFFELVYLIRLATDGDSSLKIIQSFIVRLGSILMLILATIVGWGSGRCFCLSEIPRQASFYFFLAAGLRLGVLPLSLTVIEGPTLRRGAGNIIRLAPVAAGLSLLVRLPVDVMTLDFSRWTPLVMALLALASLYSAIRWLTSSGEIEGRPYWIIAWAALAAASVVNGAPKASLAWGTALLLPGSLMFLYYPRIQRMSFLQYLGLIGLVGLPFTPVASGWVGLVSNGVTLWTFLFILTHTIMVLGYINRMLKPGGEAGALESWARLVYPLSLIIFLQAIITVGLVGWPGSFTLGTWWPGAVSNGLLLVGLVLLRRFGISPPYLQIPASSKVAKFGNRILPILDKIFRLEWLYTLVWNVYSVLGVILRAFSAVIKSSGGILWTVLLLVLLISVIMGRGIN
jgi:hypothetical protein